MNEETSLLYAKLLGETAQITWAELQPFFARGALLSVQPGEDMVGVALAMAENDQAQDWQARDPLLWAVVVAPWVLVQERDSATLPGN